MYVAVRHVKMKSIEKQSWRNFSGVVKAGASGSAKEATIINLKLAEIDDWKRPLGNFALIWRGEPTVLSNARRVSMRNHHLCRKMP